MTIKGVGGRKRLDQDEDWKKILKEVERLAELGLLDKQICDNLDICADTFYKYINKKTEFADAVKRGRSKGVEKVSRDLLACPDSASKMFFLKVHGKWVEQDKQEMLDLKRQDLELKALIASKLSPEDAEEILKKLYSPKEIVGK